MLGPNLQSLQKHRPCEQRGYCYRLDWPQPGVAVEIDLQTKWTPSGRTNTTEPSLFIDELEAVVQTLAVIRSEIGLIGLLVMPWLICLIRLHGREDTDTPWMGAASADN